MSQRNKVVNVKFHDEEYSRFLQSAKNENLGVAILLRKLALDFAKTKQEAQQLQNHDNFKE